MTLAMFQNPYVKVAWDHNLQKPHQRCEELCPPVLPPEETLVLSHLTARFIGSSVRGCMIPSHLSPDSGVIDSDLCERRQKCQGKICVSAHIRSVLLPWNPITFETVKKSLTVMLWCLQNLQGYYKYIFLKVCRTITKEKLLYIMFCIYVCIVAFFI